MNETPMKAPNTITFDFYGTLVQWHEGVEAAFREILVRHGKPAADPAPLIHAFHAEGRRLRDTPPWKPYRQVLRGSLRFALNQDGRAMCADDVAGLITRLSALPAHPDVPAALAAFRQKGFRLAAISNTDDDLISGSLPSLGLALDAVITAQQARAYKPDPRLFVFAHAALGVTPAEVIHVAASQPLDMAVCKALGLRAFWVNRRGEQAEAQWLPFTEVTDVAEAARLIIS
ncbi:MAG: haloacid dehalogenase type II [Reyranella sp.]|nr:haloacid dehalogenase type II [Reyranella sp.]